MSQEWGFSCARLVRTLSLLAFRIFPILCPITGHQSDEARSAHTQDTRGLTRHDPSQPRPLPDWLSLSFPVVTARTRTHTYISSSLCHTIFQHSESSPHANPALNQEIPRQS